MSSGLDFKESKEEPQQEKVAPAPAPADLVADQAPANGNDKNNDKEKVNETFDDDPPGEEAATFEVYEAFDDMGLKENLLRGVFANAFEKPSYIQQRAIMPVIRGHDTIAQAQSGSGKTGAFSIAALQRIDHTIKSCQALVLSPTRELAGQSHAVMSALGFYMKDLRIHGCIGGTAVREDIAALRSGVEVVVGTPGRVIDMVRRNVLRLNHLKMLILDEADELLSRGFMEAIYELFSFVPEDVQVCLFSATMPSTVLQMSSKFMRSPVRILVKNEDVTLQGIKQYFVDVEREDIKFEVLCDLYERLDISAAIVFVNTQKKATWLAERLNQEDFTVSLIHGGLDSNERKRVMGEFRRGNSRILISTDLLARGIDVYQVNMVLNYDIPKDKENYIHRIGRSGRHGRKGLAINFVTARDVYKLQEIERFYSTEVVEMPDQDMDDLLGA